MTPAISRAKRANIEFQVHEYEHDPKVQSYGDEAADKLGLDPTRVFKTLIVARENRELAVAVLPVANQLDLKLLARVMGSKKVAMADKQRVERVTGYVLGGVSPLGQRKTLKTIIDESALQQESIFVSAGRRGLEIELSPFDLCSLTGGEFAAISK